MTAPGPHPRLLWLPLALALMAACALPGVGRAADTAPTAQEFPAYERARAAVTAERWDDAIRLLDPLVRDEPRNADALNLLAYSHRNAGDLDRAYTLYQRALAVDPDHLGALEYLGELYLQRDEPAKAEDLLARLERLCRSGCEERDELSEAIQAYRKRATR